MIKNQDEKVPDRIADEVEGKLVDLSKICVEGFNKQEKLASAAG